MILHRAKFVFIHPGKQEGYKPQKGKQIVE